ncbi:hypothetical protein B0H12DRAFT_1236308 [Mycena haematopus]|nr:hypothetical protein B0H12DRAFT_1236308 [Mycena haematopus]
MSIHVSLSTLLITALLVGLSTAQSSASPSPSASPASGSASLHMSSTVRAIVGACITVGVFLIVIASYFCCCHAACRAARARSMKGTQDQESRYQTQQQDAVVRTPRTSTDKKGESGSIGASTTIMDVPPSYDEVLRFDNGRRLE